MSGSLEDINIRNRINKIIYKSLHYLQYNIKKKEEIVEPQIEEPANPLMRKKKTPEELAREAEAEDQDEFTKLKNSIETQVNEIKTQIESRCSLQ